MMEKIARLHLTRDQLAALRTMAARAYPNEGCALLIGRDRPDGAGAEVTRIVPAANVDPEPARGFELDPRVLVRELRALREAAKGRGGDERLLGHMHSHPDAPPVPSARDRAQAFEAGQVWLIVPVRRGRAGAPRAHQALAAADGRMDFQPVALARPQSVGEPKTARTTNSLIARAARSR